MSAANMPDVDVSATTSADSHPCTVSAENELRNMQIRLEMLKLQQQIRELEGNARAAPYVRRIDLAELDAAVPLFTGDDNYDITKWWVQFEDYSDACGYNGKEKCVGIRRRLGGTAKNT